MSRATQQTLRLSAAVLLVGIVAATAGCSRSQQASRSQSDGSVLIASDGIGGSMFAVEEDPIMTLQPNSVAGANE